MENIVIVNFSKGPLYFDGELFAKSEKEKINLSVVPRLRYSQSSDYIGFQLDVILTLENTQIYKTGFLIGMLVPEWSEMLKSGVNLTIERARLLDICRTGWLVATGVIAQQTQTPQGEFILPPVDIKKLTEEVLLVSSDIKEN